VRIGLDSYTYHRLLGELRPGEEDPGERLADGGAAVVSEARALGVDAVSLETCFLGPPSRLDVTALRQSAAGLELALAWGAPEGLALGTRPDALDDLLDWIDLASALGCRLMRVVAGGPRLRARADEWPATVAPLRRAAERAQELALELALENHGDLTAAQIDSLLDAVAHPALGVCFDTANAPRVGDDPLEAARLLAPRIRMVHLKDVEAIESAADPVAGPRSVPYGEGIIPVEAVLSTLAAAGFGGLVCVEIAQLGPGVDERALAATCVRWLRARNGVHEAAVATGADVSQPWPK
jgi:3-oxoisoapionate decarboxylase